MSICSRQIFKEMRNGVRPSGGRLGTGPGLCNRPPTGGILSWAKQEVSAMKRKMCTSSRQIHKEMRNGVRPSAGRLARRVIRFSKLRMGGTSSRATQIVSAPEDTMCTSSRQIHKETRNGVRPSAGSLTTGVARCTKPRTGVISSQALPRVLVMK